MTPATPTSTTTTRESSFTRTLQQRHSQARGETWLGPSAILVSLAPSRHCEELIARAKFDKATLGIIGDKSTPAADHLVPSSPMLAILDTLGRMEDTRHFSASVLSQGQVEWIDHAKVDCVTHCYPIYPALVHGADDELKAELCLHLLDYQLPDMEPALARHLLETTLEAAEACSVPTWELLSALAVVLHLSQIRFENVLTPPPENRVVPLLHINSVPPLSMAAKLMGVERRTLEAHLAFTGSTLDEIHAKRDDVMRQLHRAVMAWLVEQPDELDRGSEATAIWFDAEPGPKVLPRAMLLEHVELLREEDLHAQADALQAKFAAKLLSGASPPARTAVCPSAPMGVPLTPKNEPFITLFAPPRPLRSGDCRVRTRYWVLAINVQDKSGQFSSAVTGQALKALGVPDVSALLACVLPGRASVWECEAIVRAAGAPEGAVDAVLRAFGASEWVRGKSRVLYRGARTLNAFLWDLRLGRDPTKRDGSVKAMTKLKRPLHMQTKLRAVLYLVRLLKVARARHTARKLGCRVVAVKALLGLYARVKGVLHKGYFFVAVNGLPETERFLVLRRPQTGAPALLSVHLCELDSRSEGHDGRAVVAATAAAGDAAVCLQLAEGDKLVVATGPALAPIWLAALNGAPTTRPKPARPPARALEPTQPSRVEQLVKELVLTEKAYVDDLHTLVLYFYRPLELSLMTVEHESKAVLPRAELDAIFSNVTQVLKANQELLSAMSADNPASFAQAFGEMVPYLKHIYLVYVANYSLGVATLDRNLKQRPKFAAFVKEAARKTEQELESFLIKPVQRLCKYPLFFKQLVDEIEAGPTRDLFSSAFESVNTVASEVNQMQSGAALAARASFVLGALEGAEGVWSALEPGRVYLTEFECDVLPLDENKAPAGSAQPRSFFLYTDAFVETKPNANRTKYKFKRWFEPGGLHVELPAPDDGLSLHVISFCNIDDRPLASLQNARRGSTGSILGVARKRISIGGRSSSVILPGGSGPGKLETFSLVFFKTAQRDEAKKVIAQTTKEFIEKRRLLEMRQRNTGHSKCETSAIDSDLEVL